MPEKHGQSRSREGYKPSHAYYSWQAMKRRCYDEKLPKYPQYGGRGIQVCDRWRNSFVDFLKDMGEPPEGHTIDRINGNGDYTPDNCRWADIKTQSRNRKSNHLITFEEETLCMTAWAERLGVSRSLIKDRLRMGWSVEDAFRLPAMKPGTDNNRHPQRTLAQSSRDSV